MTAKSRSESCAGPSTSVIIALAYRFSSNRETAGSLPSPQPSYDAKRPLRRRKEEADKRGGGVRQPRPQGFSLKKRVGKALGTRLGVRESKVYYGKCTSGV